MQITGEMVEAARIGWINSIGKNPHNIPDALRAALEAAWGAKELKCDNGMLKHLRVTAELTAQGMKNSKPGDYLEGQAAACIEDLAAALKPFALIDWGYGRVLNTEDYNRARATLERWGLK